VAFLRSSQGTAFTLGCGTLSQGSSLRERSTKTLACPLERKLDLKRTPEKTSSLGFLRLNCWSRRIDSAKFCSGITSVAPEIHDAADVCHCHDDSH
jgi:hypothetical protein